MENSWRQNKGISNFKVKNVQVGVQTNELIFNYFKHQVKQTPKTDTRQTQKMGPF